jgi:DNA-binding XRE family transcriptional regulator
MSAIKIDPEFKALIPPLAPEEYAQLESNLKAEGCRDPLVTWEGILIDGHNRFEICTKHGIGFEKINKRLTDRSEAIEWIIRNQFGRRNLDAYQRTRLALRLEEAIAARAKANSGHRTDLPQKSAEGYKPVGETREEIAKLAGVSRDTVDKVKQIERKAAPEVKQALAKGEISINKAHLTVKTPKQADDEPEAVVVDEVGTRPTRSNIKVMESNGMAIYASAKCVMDRLSNKDAQWSESLAAMIQYCERRIKSKK